MTTDLPPTVKVTPGWSNFAKVQGHFRGYHRVKQPKLHQILKSNWGVKNFIFTTRG